MPISIAVHGGAGNFNVEHHEAAQRGCRDASLLGWRILQEGGSALDAVEATVRALEDNPVFNAGTGACLSIEGNIELDAGIMDGRTLDLGAVAGVELIKNPISLARKVLESPHVLLMGRGAEHFAEEQGIAQCTFEELLTEHQYQRWKEYLKKHDIDPEDEPNFIRRQVGVLAARDKEKHGTVGAVALDSTGAFAAATSTGGINNKYPGRVGDSPLVGCGFYADEQAAVSCTGHGEDFVRLMLAKRAADFVAHGMSADEAAQSTIAFLRARASGVGGLILVDARGGVGVAWNSPRMARAFMTEALTEPVTGI